LEFSSSESTSSGFNQFDSDSILLSSVLTIGIGEASKVAIDVSPSLGF